jgi:uncharacterized protein
MNEDANTRNEQLLMAAQRGEIETVLKLLQEGADINMRDSQKENLLLHAGAQGWLDILKLAIEAKADTRLTNRFGGISIIPAAERGHVETVRELLTRTDINVNHVNNLGWTALLEAIVLGDGGQAQQHIVQLLVDHGADVNIPDKDGVTPLRHARERGFMEIERILVKAGGH